MGVRLPDRRSASMMPSPSICPGRHPVHDDHVIGLARRHEQAIPAVAGVIHRVTGFMEPLGDEPRNPLVVLDEQQLQCGLLERGRHVQLFLLHRMPPEARAQPIEIQIDPQES